MILNVALSVALVLAPAAGAPDRDGSDVEHHHGPSEPAPELRIRNPLPLIITSAVLLAGMPAARFGTSGWAASCERKRNCPDGLGWNLLSGYGIAGAMGAAGVVTGGIGFGWLGRKHAHEHLEAGVAYPGGGLGATIAGGILTMGSATLWVTSLVVWRAPPWLGDLTFSGSTLGLAAGVATLTYGVGYLRYQKLTRRLAITPSIGHINGIRMRVNF